MCLGVGGTEKTLCDAGGVGARCVGAALGKIACGGDDAGRRASVAAGRARAAGIGIAAKTSDAQMGGWLAGADVVAGLWNPLPVPIGGSGRSANAGARAGTGGGASGEPRAGYGSRSESGPGAGLLVRSAT